MNYWQERSAFVVARAWRALTCRALISASVATLLMLLPAWSAWAEEPRSSESPVVRAESVRVQEPYELPAEFEPGVWPTAAAIFPGVLFHGSGLWLAGDDRGAYNLARIQSVGLLTTTLSIMALFGSGASADTIEWIAYPGLVGASALIAPWFFDIYGASVGGREAGARAALPPVEARLGYAYIYDPVFAYSQFTHAQAEVRLEPLRLVPSAWFAVDDDNQRLRLEANFRLFGPRTGAREAQREARADGSFFDLESAVTYHNFGTEGFESVVLEASLAARYDMRRLTPALRGSFAELALGAGSQFMGYDEDSPIGEDISALLLMRSVFGVYLGPSGSRYGEAKLYYDHRHDGFIAGTGLGTNIDGLMGHVGAEGFYYLSENWGAFADVQVGSAYMGTAGVKFRFGGSQ